MPVEEQKVNDVADNGRRFEALFLCAMDDEIPPESTWLAQVGQFRINLVLPVGVGEGSRPSRSWSAIVLPFVDIVAGFSR